MKQKHIRPGSSMYDRRKQQAQAKPKPKEPPFFAVLDPKEGPALDEALKPSNPNGEVATILRALTGDDLKSFDAGIKKLCPDIKAGE